MAENESESAESAPDSAPDSAIGASDRRTLRGLIVKPREQMKYTFVFMGGSMLMLMIFVGITMYVMNNSMLSIEIAYGLDPEIAAAIRRTLMGALSVVLLVSAVLSAFSLLRGLQLSHRLFGPLIPIQRHIEHLKAGDFSSRIHLRKHDEFLELQDSLNDLAAEFERRYGGSVKKRDRD